MWTAVANKQPIEAGYQGDPDYSALTDLAETVRDSFACPVIDAVAIAGAGYTKLARIAWSAFGIQAGRHRSDALAFPRQQ